MKWISSSTLFFDRFRAILLLPLLLVLFSISPLSNAKNIVVTEGVSNFTYIYSDPYGESHGTGEDSKFYTYHSAELLSVNGKTFKVRDMLTGHEGYLLRTATRCIVIPNQQGSAFDNEVIAPCASNISTRSTLTTIANSIYEVTDDVDAGVKSINRLTETMNKIYMSLDAVTGQEPTQLYLTGGIITGCIVILIFVLTQVIAYFQRKFEKKDAKLALSSEIRVNVNNMKNYLSKVVGEGDGSAQECLGIHSLQNGVILSENIYENLNASHLRHTNLIGTIVQLYTNYRFISEFKAESQLSGENKSKDIELQGYLFFLEVCIILLQSEYTLSLLDKYWVGEADRIYVEPTGFSDVLNIFRDIKVAQKPYGKLTALLVFLREKIYFAFSNFDFPEAEENPEFTFESPQELNRMLDSIKDKERREFIMEKYVYISDKIEIHTAETSHS